MRILLLAFALFVVRVHGVYEYECIRLSDCANGGTCTSGSCTCPATHTGDSCLQPALGAICATLACSNGGTCYVEDVTGTEKCDCLYGFLGATCETPAAELRCLGSSIQYDLSFDEKFNGVVQLEQASAVPTVCDFDRQPAVDGVVTYTLEIELNTETAANPLVCGMEFITEKPETPSADQTSTKYERLVRIQYLANLVTAVDEIANMTCIHQDTNLTMSAEISSITLDGIGNLTVTDTDEFYSPVTMVLLDSGELPMSQSSALHVGDTFYIHMYITDASIFTTIVIEGCIANDTDAVAPKLFPMMNQRCPTKSGKKTAALQQVKNVPQQDLLPDLAGVKVPVKAFKFLFSDKLGLVCTVKLCEDGDPACALPSESDCEAVINPPPVVDPATDTATDPATDTGGDTATDPATDTGGDTATDPATDTGGATDAGGATGTEGATDPGGATATDPATDPATGTDTGGATGTDTATNPGGTTDTEGDTAPGGDTAAATGDTTEPAAGDTPIVRKRRSEDEKRTLSTVVTVLGPRDFMSDASTGDDVALTVESCLARSEVMAILVVLGAIVCILFIACLVLALCLIRRRHVTLKGAPPSPKNDRFHIPRAHVNGAYTRDV